MRKAYVCFENNQHIVRVVQGFVPESVVCECSPQDDLSVMDIVDNIDELTGAVIGKKLQFNEVKYEQKQIELANQANQRLAEQQRQADLEYLRNTDYVIIKLQEAHILGQDVGTLMVQYSEVLNLRQSARNRLQ